MATRQPCGDAAATNGMVLARCRQMTKTLGRCMSVAAALLVSMAACNGGSQQSDGTGVGGQAGGAGGQSGSSPDASTTGAAGDGGMAGDGGRGAAGRGGAAGGS